VSEFLAEAQVLIRPNTATFRAALVTQLAAATKGIVVPIAVAPVAAGGVSALAGATSGLAAAQSNLVSSSAAVAGAQNAVAASTKKSTAALLGAGSATAKLDAGLLGLRTALGSTAVIGLGALALAAIVAGKAISASIKNFAAFQQELSTFRVVAGASADEMRRVSEQATRLGADVRLPAVSAADAAVAMTELAKAGLTVEDALAGAEGVLQLATAAQISFADAALITANALNSFGLEGDQATVVADGFANAANAAQGSIADMGLAFKQASAVARQVGLSLQDTQAILSLFAKNGLQGSDAGTSLRVALIKLVAPTDKAAKVIKELGIQIRDAQGNVRADIFAQFGEATRNLTPAFRDAAAAAIFGQDAIRAVSIGAREGAEGLRIMQAEIDKQGTAAEVAAARTEGLGGKFSALSSQAQTLSVALGKLASPILSGVIDQLLAAGNAALKLGDILGQIEGFIPAGAEKEVQDFRGIVVDLGKRGLGPFAGFTLTAKAALDIYNKTVTTSEERVAKLNEELQALQDIRASAEEATPGPSPIDPEIIKRIKELRAEIKELKTEGGGVGASVSTPLQKALEGLDKLKASSREGVDTSWIDRMKNKLIEEATVAAETARENDRLTRGMGDLGNSATKSAGGVDELSRALRSLKAASFAANSELLKLQNEGAGPQAEIANLRGQRKIQEDRIAAIKANGNQAGDASKINAIREDINRIQGEIEGLLTGIASDAKAAAATTKKKADDIAQAQEDATRAFIEGFSPRRQKLANALIEAGLTERLSDDIKSGKAIVAFLKALVQAIKGRISSLQLTGDALKAAQAAIAAINQEIFNTLNDIASDQQDAIKRTQEILNQKLDFKIQIADAQGNVAAQIRAHRAKLAQITKELVKAKKQYGKNSVQWLELRAAQVEEIARIKELEGTTKEKGNAFRELTFQFLQTQQGFASNLLGNLIPGFATGGLVGGSSGGGGGGGIAGAIRGVDPLTGRPLGESGRPGTGLEKESAIAGGKDRGVSSGQGSTQIQLLRGILRALQNLNGRASHPEATYQRGTGRSTMDTFGV
jgi:TP901 family phage tail tape measure protein